jgi:hypothetical protein
MVKTLLFEFGAKEKNYIRLTLRNLLKKSDIIEELNKPKLPHFLNSVSEHIEQLIKESKLSSDQIKTMFQNYHRGLYYDGIVHELEQIAKNYPALGEHNPIVIDYNHRQDGVLQLGLYEANRLSSLPDYVLKTVSVEGSSRQIREKVPEPIMDEVYNPLACFMHHLRAAALRRMLQKYFPNLPSEQIKYTPTEQISAEVIKTDHFSYLFGKAYEYLFEARE